MPHITRPCPKCAVPIDIPQPTPVEMNCPSCDVLIRFKAPAAPPQAARPAPSAAVQVKTAPARMIAGHEVQRELAHGGLGVVYLAFNSSSKGLRAIKRPLQGAAHLDSTSILARFRQEVQAVDGLNSPHIVRSYDAGSDDAGPYLVMEYLDGESLNNLVSRHGRLPVPEACELIRQAALGLQAGHESGLVHRDVKPSNLMLARSKASGARVVVIDWGLAKTTDEGPAASKRLTRLGDMMGTPDYIAPEQIRDAQSVDIRADIYSLGATLYFLLAGQPPYAGLAGMKKIAAHAREEFPPLEQLRPDLPNPLLNVLKKMVRKEPRDRHATPGEVAEALQPFCCAESHRLLALFAPLPMQKANPGSTGGSFGGVTLPPGASGAVPPVQPLGPSSETTVTTPQRPTTPTTVHSVGGRRKGVWLALAGCGTLIALSIGVSVLVGVVLYGKSGSSIQGADAGKNPGQGSGDHTGQKSTDGGTPTQPAYPRPPSGPVLTGVEPKSPVSIVGHPAGYEVTSIVFLPDGKHVAARLTNSVYIWDLEERKQTPSPFGGSVAGTGLVVVSSQKDKKQIAASFGSVVNLFEGGSYTPKSPIRLEGTCTALSISPDGEMVATAELRLPKKDAVVSFWNCNNRYPIEESIQKPLKLNAPVVSLSFSPDGQFLATSNGGWENFHWVDSGEHKIRIWPLKGEEPAREFEGHKKSVCGIAYFADGKRLFSASPLDGTLRVWNVDMADKEHFGSEALNKIQAGKPTTNLTSLATQSQDVMIAATFWPWGRALIGLRHGGLVLYDMDTGTKLDLIDYPSLDAHAYVTALAISPDGHHAVAAYTDGKVYLFRLPTPSVNR